ncbi:hypothetical protein WISP_138794 [Willisornis vidua]|uniref:Uncharacterized protein n=1 Tax=Willisornis vidua TaxID=1566151 RepID=A0ABQ9CT89_9PASS|nr:hypothetical protein WISP_138794 [Willisornis vidua]
MREGSAANTCERLRRIVRRVLSGETGNKGRGITLPSKGQMTQAIIVSSHQKDGSEVTSSPSNSNLEKAEKLGKFRVNKGRLYHNVPGCGGNGSGRGTLTHWDTQKEHGELEDKSSPVVVPILKFPISLRLCVQNMSEWRK